MASRAVDITDRTFRFGLAVIALVRRMPRTLDAAVLGRQALRAGVSVGANVEEAEGAGTKREFAYRMTVAQREAREVSYWLRLIRAAESAPDDERTAAVLREAEELKKILGAIVSSAKGTRKAR